MSRYYLTIADESVRYAATRFAKRLESAEAKFGTRSVAPGALYLLYELRSTLESVGYGGLTNIMFSENRLGLDLTDAMLPSESSTIESFEEVGFDGIFPREYEDAKTRLTAFLTREAVKPGNEAMAPRLMPLATEISKLSAEGSLYFLNVPALIPRLVDAVKKDGSALSVASLVRHIHLVCDRRASRKDEAAGVLSKKMADFAALSRAQLGQTPSPEYLDFARSFIEFSTPIYTTENCADNVNFDSASWSSKTGFGMCEFLDGSGFNLGPAVEHEMVLFFESLFRVVHPESPRKSPFGMMAILQTIATNSAYSGTDVGKVVREYQEQIRSKWNAESRTSGKVVLSKTAAFLCDSVAGFVTGVGGDGFLPIIRSFCESLVGAVRPVWGATGPSKFYDITKELPVLRSQSAPVVVGGNLSVSTGGPGDFIVQAWSDLELNYQVALHFVVLCVYSFAPRTTSLQKLLWFVGFLANAFLVMLSLINMSQLNTIFTFATDISPSYNLTVSRTQSAVTNTTLPTFKAMLYAACIASVLAIARVCVPAILPALSDIETVVENQAETPKTPVYSWNAWSAVRGFLESAGPNFILQPGREWLALFSQGSVSLGNTAAAIVAIMFSATAVSNVISQVIIEEQSKFFDDTNSQFMRLVEEYVAQFNFVDVLPVVMAISAPVVEGTMKFLEVGFLANDMPRGVVLARRFQSAYQEAVIAVSITSFVVSLGIFDESGAVYQQFQAFSPLQRVANAAIQYTLPPFFTEIFSGSISPKMAVDFWNRLAISELPISRSLEILITNFDSVFLSGDFWHQTKSEVAAYIQSVGPLVCYTTFLYFVKFVVRILGPIAILDSRTGEPDEERNDNLAALSTRIELYVFKSVKRREEVDRVSDGFTIIRKLYTSFAALFKEKGNGIALKNAMDRFLNNLVAKYNFKAYVKTIGDRFLLPSTAFTSDVACIIYHRSERFETNRTRLKAKTGALLQIELDIFTDTEVAWFDAFCGKIYLSKKTNPSVIYAEAMSILNSNVVDQADVIATVRKTMKAGSKLSTLVDEKLPPNFFAKFEPTSGTNDQVFQREGSSHIRAFDPYGVCSSRTGSSITDSRLVAAQAFLALLSLVISQNKITFTSRGPVEVHEVDLTTLVNADVRPSDRNRGNAAAPEEYEAEYSELANQLGSVYFRESGIQRGDTMSAGTMTAVFSLISFFALQKRV